MRLRTFSVVMCFHLAMAARIAWASELPLNSNINNYYLRGTQPNSLASGNDIVVATDECADCHSDPATIYRSWSGTLMAHSGRDPLFYACLDIANADSPGSGDLCIRCHVPKAWLEGRSTPVNGTAIQQGDRDSITCNLCHRMVDPFNVLNDAPGIDAQILSDLGADAPVQSMDRGALPSIGYGGSGSYVVDPHDRRRGPFPIADPGPAVPPEVECDNYHFGFTYGKCEDDLQMPTGCPTFESPIHRRSELCATCHDVSLPHFSYNPQGTALVFNGSGNHHPDGNKYNMAPEQRTFSEWLKSDFAVGNGVNMGNRYGCNVGEVSECQDCHAPANSTLGCAFQSPRDDVPRHTFRGASSWVLDAIAAHYGPNGPFGTYPPPSGSPPDFYPDVVDNMTAQVQENISKMLNCAADLQVTLDDSQSPGLNKLKVRVVNQTGHKLPTGYPEGRRMWLTVQYFDCTDYTNAMQTLGGYDNSSAVLDKDSTKVYEMKLGLDGALAAMLNRPEGPSGHAILGNKIYKDNRIPPRGFTNLKFAAIQAEPVAYSYADGQYWDDTFFDIPGYAVAARVYLYYQSTSKEYAEFLRDSNPNQGNPQNRGQFLHDLWTAFGKSAPIMMASFPPPSLPDCQVTPDPAYPCGDPTSITGYMNISLKGDLTGDRAVTTADIPDFVQVLLGSQTDPRKICAADMNSLNGPNGDDIKLFVDQILP
jgi:hypothetical protein